MSKKNKNIKKILASMSVLIVLVVVFYFSAKLITNLTGFTIINNIKINNLFLSLTGKTIVDNSDNISDFAKCLSDNNVKMYGAYWCGHCQNQKAMFGDNGKVLVDSGIYAECDPNGESSQTDLCLEKGIQGYPTWEINGKFYPGEQSLSKLAELTGCMLNK